MADKGGEDLAQRFVQFALDSGVLRFGEFKIKSGRMSPYFFNAGLFDDGAKREPGAFGQRRNLVGLRLRDFPRIDPRDASAVHVYLHHDAVRFGRRFLK